MRGKVNIISIAIFLAFFMLVPPIASAEDYSAPAIQWQKSIGDQYFDLALSVWQTSDGSYIVARANQNTTPYIGCWSSSVIKLNSDGNIEWESPIPVGGIPPLNYILYSICQTSDGSYIATGERLHYDGNVTWGVDKLDENGNIVDWTDIGSYGLQYNIPHNVQPTSDGGCIIAGYMTITDWDNVNKVWIKESTRSFGQVIKLDKDLHEMWRKSFNISSDTWCARQTSDGGYIVGINYIADTYIYKLDADGNTLWEKKYGGSHGDSVRSIQQTSDGGYIFTGDTYEDMWTVKLDASGDIEWQKALGGSASEIGLNVQQTFDGGYIVIGQTSSRDGDTLDNHGSAHSTDAWLVKFDANGNVMWKECVGGEGNEDTRSGQQTLDGGYIISGSSNSFLAEDDGYYDAWIVKLAPEDDSIAPIADFTATPISGTVPLEVSFNDTSTNSPTSRLWDFGDGTTSSEQNISHTYVTAGTYSVNLSVTNSKGNSYKTTQIDVLKTTPTITWEPADLTYGIGLGEAQLNAVASVSGTYTYTPPAGTILSAGDNQNLHVDFTPTDVINYNPLSFDSKVNVLKATPTVTWNQPADILTGTQLDSTQLNAVASILGTFVYTPPSGTVLSAGQQQTLQTVFTPDDSVNYNTVTTNVNINVLTPLQKVQEIKSTIEGLIASGSLNKGQGNSLISKLDAAMKKLNTGDTKAAMNELNAFINEVEADIKSGKLSSTEGEALINAATTVINVIR